MEARSMPPPTETQAKKNDFVWLSENLQRIDREYDGKWVAIANNSVAGADDDRQKAYDEALRKYPSERPLIYHARNKTTSVPRA